MIVHLIDGTYELFRHFYGLRRFHKTDPPFGAVAGVLGTTMKMIEDGATHIGVLRITSSNRFATNYGPATKQARESIARYGHSSIRLRMRSPRWE